MGAMVLTADGRQAPIVMGSYGIGVERIMSAAVELYHDADGIIWPKSIAPFSLILTPVNYKGEVRVVADRLYEEFRKAGVDVLLDDRPERPGVKFKDADLIGIPYRVVIGEEKVRKGQVELFDRAAKQLELIGTETVIPTVRSRLDA
jgi:prolyl-tRNA synthetase